MGTAAIWTKRAAMITGIVFIGFGLWFIAAEGGPSDTSGKGFEMIAVLALVQGVLYMVPNRHLAVSMPRILGYMAITLFPPFLAVFIVLNQYVLHSFQVIGSVQELAGLLLIAAASLCAPLSLLLSAETRRRHPGNRPKDPQR